MSVTQYCNEAKIDKEHFYKYTLPVLLSLGLALIRSNGSIQVKEEVTGTFLPKFLGGVKEKEILENWKNYF